MKHIYTVNPVEHQPQWPANDNKPSGSFAIKLLTSMGIAFLILLLPASIIGGLLSMTVAP